MTYPNVYTPRLVGRGKPGRSNERETQLDLFTTLRRSRERQAKRERYWLHNEAISARTAQGKGGMQ